MKRMLFNATQQEELRVAIVDGQKLLDIDIETSGREQHKSNIYKAVITRIEPSLEACFVNYGEDRHGFLPFKEVGRAYFKEGVDVKSASIKSALREGQEITVQVEKEERGTKGAALTTFISLAGRYLVLMPNNPRGGGVSRRVEGEERQELRETMDKLEVPPGMSVIARTAGIGRSVDELQWDLNYLLQLWRAIESAGDASGAFLIYQESSLVIRAIRDHFQPDIGEILIDTDDVYEQARQFMSHVMPDMVHRVKRYTDDIPLFSRFQIEHQIETAYSRHVPLPSGGAIVIDHTEALVSIDVNSARSTRGTDIETTAFNTNCEAAEEVARQLRLRDLGGLIVIDFIDMESSRNQREVENRLKEALRFDRARVQTGKISRFGLMELSRQRLRPALSEGSHVPCPRCNGTGHIRDTESSALQILRIIQEEAMKENSAMIHAQMPVDVAAFLLNEKRSEIQKIEIRLHVRIVVIPNKHLETPHYRIERIKHDDPRLEDSLASYSLAESVDTDEGFDKRKKEPAKPKQEAVVKGITPNQPAPVSERPQPAPAPLAEAESGGGFFSRLFGFFRKKPVESDLVAPAPAKESRASQTDTRGGRNRNRRRGGRDRAERTPIQAGLLAETQKPPSAEQAESARPAREPRPQREQRQRGERKDRVREADSTTVPAQAITVSNAETAQPTKPVPALDEELAAVTLTAGMEGREQADEPRRRRRRGGRNRNRRDRDDAIKTVANGEDDALPEVIDAEENIVASETTPAVPQAEPPAMVVADLSPSDEPLPDMMAGEHEKQPILTAAPDQHVAAAEPREARPSSVTPMTEVIEISADSQEAPFCWTAPELSSQTAVNESSAATPPAAETAVVEPQADTMSIVVSAGESVEAVPSVTLSGKDAVVAAPAIQQESLQTALESAGLLLAATDPEKLRAAQEAAQNAEPAPRLGRPRKPAPTLADEPLIQVDTRLE